MHLTVWTTVPITRATHTFCLLFNGKLWISSVINFRWDIRIMRPSHIWNIVDLERLADLAFGFEPESFFYALHRRFAKDGILQCGGIIQIGMKADFEHHGWHMRLVILTVSRTFLGLTCNIEIPVWLLRMN